MDKETTTTSAKSVASAAEARMRQWAFEAQREGPERETSQEERVEQGVRPYLAISREAGVDGSALADRLEGLLGWESFDRDFLEYVADHYQTRRQLLEVVDETSANWFEEALGKWFDSRVVTQSEYLAKVEKFVWFAARRQNCIFVGRGCHLILPYESGLSVFVTAPREMRVRHVADSRGCNEKEAEKQLAEVEGQRRDFYRQNFQQEMGDMQYHDFGVNLRQTSIDAVAEWLAEQVRRRFGDRAGGSNKPRSVRE